MIKSFLQKLHLLPALPESYTVYTDGSCQPNPGPGGWAFVVVEQAAVKFQGSGCHPQTTNNRMEYQAAIEAVRFLAHQDPNLATKPIYLFTDSELLVKTFNLWMEAWAQNQWQKRQDSGPIKNLDLVQELYVIKQTYPQLKLAWVRGHAGQEFNEIVDQLAKAAISHNR